MLRRAQHNCASVLDDVNQVKHFARDDLVIAICVCVCPCVIWVLTSD